MSETPISDSTPHNVADLGMQIRRLERQLNAANDRIKQLEEMYEGVIGENPALLGSNVMGLLKRELTGTQKRIKRLEEAGDEMADLLEEEMFMKLAIQWRKAKEDKL